MMKFLDAVDSVLYYPILLVVMAAAGLYFSVRMGICSGTLATGGHPDFDGQTQRWKWN